MFNKVTFSKKNLKTRTKIRNLSKLCLLSTFFLIFTACSSHQTNFNNLPQVDLKDLEGEWYIIANIPYFFEKGHVGTSVEYMARKDDEKFDDIYRFKDKNFTSKEESYNGIAKIENKNTNAEWSSSFFWPVSFSWNIYDLNTENQTLVVGHPSGKYAWIMGRQPKLSESKYQELLTLLEKNGFEKNRLRKVPQFQEQLGQPGFQ